MNRFVLCVGVDRPPGMEALRYAAKDATDVRDHHRSSRGGSFSEDETFLLMNRTATITNLNDVLSAIPKNLESLTIFFGGHGNHLGVALQDGFLPFDSLIPLINRTEARRKLAILDACGSGGFLRRHASLEGLGDLASRAAHAKALFESVPGARILLSCSPDENSHEGFFGPNGDFTRALLNACEHPLANKNGVITARAAFQFAELLLKESGRPQTPEWHGSLEDYPMAVGVPPARKSDGPSFWEAVGYILAGAAAGTACIGIGIGISNVVTGGDSKPRRRG